MARSTSSPPLNLLREPVQEHDSVDDAVRGCRRTERRPLVDARPSPRAPAGDEEAVRPRQHPPSPPQKPLSSATGAPEAARAWTYLRPPSEQVVVMTCSLCCIDLGFSTTEPPVSSVVIILSSITQICIRMEVLSEEPSIAAQAPADAVQARNQPLREQPTAAVALSIQAPPDDRARQQDSNMMAGPGWSPWKGSAFSPAGGGGGGLLGALNLAPLGEEPPGSQPSQLSARSVDSLPPFAVPGRTVGGSAIGGLRSISAQLSRPPPTEQPPFAGMGGAAAQLPYSYYGGGQPLLMQQEDEELLDALCCPITQVRVIVMREEGLRKYWPY